mgnify:CR=1 FL=1
MLINFDHLYHHSSNYIHNHSFESKQKETVRK